MFSQLKDRYCLMPVLGLFIHFLTSITWSLSGQNTHLLISILIKHLEHKAILKQPEMQLSIVEVTATLAEQSKAQASVAIIGAISDLVRHLRKTMHFSLGSEEHGDEIIKWNDKFRTAVDDCLVQLSKKVCSLSAKSLYFKNLHTIMWLLWKQHCSSRGLVCFIN